MTPEQLIAVVREWATGDGAIELESIVVELADALEQSTRPQIERDHATWVQTIDYAMSLGLIGTYAESYMRKHNPFQAVPSWVGGTE